MRWARLVTRQSAGWQLDRFCPPARLRPPNLRLRFASAGHSSESAGSGYDALGITSTCGRIDQHHRQGS